MIEKVRSVGMVGFAIAVGVIVLLAGCRRESEPVPDATQSEAPQPGTPAQAVLIAPEPSELDAEEGLALGPAATKGRPRSYVSLTQERDKGLYHITLQDPYAEMFETAEGNVVRVRGGGARRKPGSPDIGGLAWVLPGKVGWNLMPTVTDAAFASATQGVDIAAIAVRKVIEGESEEADPIIERVRSPEIYAQDALFPSHVVRVQEAWAGTNKLVRLVVNPIQYNPVTKELRLCYRLKATLEYVKSLVPESP
ncbi:MAG: hypothetical protein ISS31_01850 [Kiritimatiellae bacterium]|nr:hypothetical protein [Kiritimatiellia bacterium]